MTTLTISEARAHLPAILDQVAAGEEITITRHGQPAAVVISPARLRSRRGEVVLAEATRVRELLHDARDIDLSESGGISADRAERLVAAVRSARKSR